MHYEYINEYYIYTIDILVKSGVLLLNVSNANRLLTREQQWTVFRMQTEEVC